MKRQKIWTFTLHFSQAPQEEPSLKNRYVRGTLCLLPQVEWTPR